MNIYQIKQQTEQTAPYYFSRKTMKFFGQTLKMFRVYKHSDGRYIVTAPMFDRFTGKQMGISTRYFNPVNNELETI